MKLVIGLVVPFVALSTLAVRVGTESVFNIKEDSDAAPVRIELAPESVMLEPSDLPVPVYHFDATRTNSWTFNAARTTVSKIPSLVGDRYLESSLGEGDTEQLYNGEINPAVWMASVPELGGLPAIDLGAKNSGRALFFDPIVNDGSIDTAYQKVNMIKGIGTVVAVHRPLPTADMPFLGGGFIKGSPQSAGDTVSYTKNWNRDMSIKYLSSHARPVFYGYRGPMGGNWMYHNGLKTDPIVAGYTGDWEISIFQPKEAKWQASGIGLYSIPSKAYERGGSQWAELYVFDCVVDEDVLRRLNVYLNYKWFGGTKLVGYNGYSSIGEVGVIRNNWSPYGGTNVVEISAGETLKIDRLSGGRGLTSRFEKEGAGTLKILDAANFGGDIVLKGGTLELSLKDVPTLESLPSGLSYRFDASDISSMKIVEDSGREYIDTWKNRTDNTVYANTEIYARGGAGIAGKRPWLVRDQFGEGLHTIDFGKYDKANTELDGRYFDFTYSSDAQTFTSFSPLSVYTVIAVMGAQRSGGNIVSLNNSHTFSRHQSEVDWMDDDDYKVPILRTDGVKYDPNYGAMVYPVSNSCVMIDGVVVDSQKGYVSPGFQVVGIRTAAETISFIGGTKVRKGGLNLSELLIYQRPLTEEEIRDVQAYLTKKWFKRVLPGYREANVSLPAARTIVSENESSINVPEGEKVRVEGITPNATVNKIGGGTLEIGPFSSQGSAQIKVVGGGVKPVAALDVVEDASCPAQGASMHLDAADEKSIYYAPGSTAGEVRYWYDKRHNNVAYMMTASKYPIRSSSGVTLNSIPVVDCQSGGVARGMYFAKDLNGVRAAFVVWQPFEGGSVFGANSSDGYKGKRVDFIRNADKKHLIINNQSSYNVRAGKAYTDGNLINVTLENYLPEEGFQLTEFYPLAASHISAIACDRGTLGGNVRYAEIILYERELSEREKVATRNYLTKKWFPDRELAPLPEKEAPSIGCSLLYAADSVFPVKVDKNGVAESISVKGTLSFEENVRFEIDGFSNVADPNYATLVLATADGFGNIANLDKAKVFADSVELTGSSLPLFTISNDSIAIP